jgi:hypothetical protein
MQKKRQYPICRSQRPRCLRNEPSSPARTLESWVRIPLEARMSVCVYSVLVFFCVYVMALRKTDPPSKESYQLCIGLRDRKRGKGPKCCRAREREIEYKILLYLSKTSLRIRHNMNTRSFGRKALCVQQGLQFGDFLSHRTLNIESTNFLKNAVF